MPRLPRNLIDNSYYHIICRGNNKAKIFNNPEDYSYFLKILLKYKLKYSIVLHNFILMINHFHFLLFCKEAKKISEFIKSLNVSYVMYYRRKYSGIGHFMQDRYKSIIVEDGKYLKECARYIEYNPIKAKIVDDLEDYKWNSYHFYTNGKFSEIIDENPSYIDIFNKNSDTYKYEYRNFVMGGAGEKRTESRIFRDAVFGSDKFRENFKEKGIKGKWSHGGRPPKKGIGTVPVILIWLVLVIIGTVPVSADFLELRNQGKHQEALFELEKLIIAEPENYDYKLHQGIILSWLGKYSESEKIFQTIIQRYPDYYDARISLARIYFWQSQYNAAENQLNYVLSKKSDNLEALELFEKIKNARRADYAKSQFLENTLSDRNDNKTLSLLKNENKTRSLNLFSTLNVLRDYEPSLNRYPYKEITFRVGTGYSGYNPYYKKIPLNIFYKTGYTKQINTNWNDNEYYLSLNTLSLNSNYSFEKMYLSANLNFNHYNNYGAAYFKIAADKMKMRPFILVNREITDYYKLYFTYYSEDWYRKSTSARSLFIEDIHTLSFSNLFIYKQNYYSIDFLRAIYSNDTLRNYSDYILQTNRLLNSNDYYDLRMNLKYKYRDYKNSHLQFYYLKTEYLPKFKKTSKFEYNFGYELSLVKPYTSIGHKFEAKTIWKFNESMHLSNTVDYFFHSAKDKDREYNVRINLEYKY